MRSTNKIDLFKVRTLGERFYATVMFVQQNWKLITKNLLCVGIPLTLAMSSRIYKCIKDYAFNMVSGDDVSLLPAFSITIISIFLLSIFIAGITGATMQKYQSGEWMKVSGWSEMGSIALSIMRNLIVQILILGIIIFVLFTILYFVVAFLVPSLPNTPNMVAAVVLMFFILVLILFILAPSISLIIMPTIVETQPIGESLKNGFRLGFKYWGSTFVTILLGGIIFSLFLGIFALPYGVYTGIADLMGISGIIHSFISFVLIVIPSLVILFTTPIYLVFLGFQYTSVKGREEKY